MTEVWFERSQYANKLKRIIFTLSEKFSGEYDIEKKMKIGKTVAYLIQVQSILIKDEKGIEERIKNLEQAAGLAKKHNEVTP